MALFDMLGDGDGTIRFQQMHAQGGLNYALQNYHTLWSKDINDYDENKWFINLMDSEDLIKISKFMYKLRDIKVSASASRGTKCGNQTELSLGTGTRLRYLPTVLSPSYGPGDPYDDSYYLSSHGQTSTWWDDDVVLYDASDQCPYLDPPPDNEQGECNQWQGGAYARVGVNGRINSTTKIYNFFDGPPTDSGSDFLGYGYINGPIYIEMSGDYFPNTQNCVEERERRTDYMVVGNVIPKADGSPSAGNGLYTPGTDHVISNNFNILGVNFTKVVARSAVLPGSSFPYVENDWTGTWSTPDVSSFRYHN